MPGSAEERLRTLGMSQYEARMYLALLRGGEQNGHELSKRAGIPSSKAYGVLDRMCESGVAQQVRRGGSTTYVALPPRELTTRLRRRYVTSIEQLEDELPQIAAGAAPAEIITIAGWDDVLAEAGRLIDGAGEELYVSLWADAVGPLQPAIDAAAQRGVEVFGMLYGEGEPPAGTWQRHTHIDIVHGRLSGHMITLVADRDDALIAHRPDDGEALAVRTDNPVICLIADEYMRHELVLQKAQQAAGDQAWDEWWTADPEVRAVMLGQALQQAS